MARLRDTSTERQHQLERLELLEWFRGYRVRLAGDRYRDPDYLAGEHAESRGWYYATAGSANRTIAEIRAGLGLPDDPQPVEIPPDIDVDAEMDRMRRHIAELQKRRAAA
jgi:hypothetical protein